MQEVLSGNLSGTAGSSTPLDISDYTRDEFTIGIEGTWGGGTMAVEVEATTGVYVPLQDNSGNNVALTINGAMFFNVFGGNIRITLSGGTAANLNYHLFH